MSVVKKVLKDCSTGINGNDYDPARVIGYGINALGGLVFICLAIFDTFQNNKFNYEGFAMGLTGIAFGLTGAAAGVALKKSTEPNHVEEQ